MVALTREKVGWILFFALACFTCQCQAQILRKPIAYLPSCGELQIKSGNEFTFSFTETARLGAPTLEEHALYKAPNHKAWESFNATPNLFKPELPADFKSKYIRILPREVLVKPRGVPGAEFNEINKKQPQLEKNRGKKGSSSEGRRPTISNEAQELGNFVDSLPIKDEVADIDGAVPSTRFFKFTPDMDVSSVSKIQGKTALQMMLGRNATMLISIAATPVPGIFQDDKLPERRGEGFAISEVNGIQCWRYGHPDDAKKVNPITQNTNLIYDPFAFREIGALTISYPDNAPTTLCSFVIIDARYLLTATHCLWKYNPHTQKPDSVYGKAKKVLWLYPKKNSAATNVSACISTDKKECNFHSLDVKDSFHAPDLYFDTATNNWHQDIALVELAKPITDPELTIVSLPPLSESRLYYLPPRSKISIAGYGGSTFQAAGWKPESGNLGMGYQVLDGQVNYEFVWRKSIQVAVAAACTGDSGGPVYSGWIYGKKEEKQHLLVAINSLIQLSISTNKPSVNISDVDSSKFSDDIKKCVSGEMSNRAQLVATALPWVCKQTQNALLSCKE